MLLLLTEPLFPGSSYEDRASLGSSSICLVLLLRVLLQGQIPADSSWILGVIGQGCVDPLAACLISLVS